MTDNITENIREDIQKVQLQRLNLVLAREKERGGFYCGLPDHLDSLAELENLPFTTEQDLLRYGDRMLLMSLRSVRKVITGSTSGTTGQTKRIYYTQGDLENTVALFMDGIGEMLGGDRSAVLIAFPDTGEGSLGSLIADAVCRLGAVPVVLPAGLSYYAVKRIIDVEQPEYYIGFPQFMLALLRLFGRMSFKRALVSGDECVPSMMTGMERILNPENPAPEQTQFSLFPHYGSRETGLAGAITCSAHRGMHLREDCIIAEIVDENGRRVPDGKFGELVVTTVGLEAQPMIRYRTGDRTRVLPGRCPCGRKTLRLDTVSRTGNLMAQLDNEVFRNPEVIDCRVSRTESGQFHIETLQTGDVTEKTCPFYPSKRYIS